MTERHTPAPCYRDRDNGVRFIRNGHRPDCAEVECQGCTPCPEPRHCSAKRNCSWHLPEGVITCGRCVGGVRRELRLIVDLSPLLLVQAMSDGVESEAANLAGPAANPEAWSWRKITAKQGRYWHVSLVEEDDEHHPYAVLTRWQTMIAEDYAHDLPDRLSIANAAAYIERNLHRIANDDEQDFRLLRAELKRCRQHIEAVIHNDDRRDQGVPCPTCRIRQHHKKCDKPECSGCLIVRLERHYAHWCTVEDCAALHFVDEWSDVWRCPKDRDHWWTQRGYAELLQARRGA